MKTFFLKPCLLNDLSGPPGASKPLLNVPGSPHVEVGKLPPKTATVPPLNHHTSSGGNTSVGSSGATLRTSGFAAALRKLAHQAKDSTGKCDKTCNTFS